MDELSQLLSDLKVLERQMLQASATLRAVTTLVPEDHNDLKLMLEAYTWMQRSMHREIHRFVHHISDEVDIHKGGEIIQG